MRDEHMDDRTGKRDGERGGPRLLLRSGLAMPALGLGVGATSSEPGQAAASVQAGLGIGYRLVDTAAAYGNEREVAEGIARSGVPREDVFLTTKLWVDDYGYDSALRAFEASLQRLGTDHVQLYLLHQPLPEEFELTVAAYRAAEHLREQGRVAAVGVCNFSAEHLAALAAAGCAAPEVNQVELHPYFTQPQLRAAHRAAGITTQAWSPIGGVSSWGPRSGQRPGPMADPVVTGIAEQVGRSAAQVLLRWHLQRGDAAVTKSFHAERLQENFDVFSFVLSDQQVAAVEALDTGQRGGRDPSSVQRSGHGAAQDAQQGAGADTGRSRTAERS